MDGEGWRDREGWMRKGVRGSSESEKGWMGKGVQWI